MAVKITGLSGQALQNYNFRNNPLKRCILSFNIALAGSVASNLKTEEDMVNYLEAAFEDGDPSLIQAALGDIARAKGMTALAQKAGLGRESLYKSLKRGGNPSFATILKVINILGLTLRLQKRA